MAQQQQALQARLGDRSLFPSLQAFAYCNHAAISPPSSAVQSAVQSALEDYAQHGLGAFLRWHEKRQQLRERMARLLGCAPADLALLPSTTRAIGDIALSIPWRAGDRILLLEGEFPTNVTPWQCAARAHQLELAWLQAESFATDQGLAQLEAKLKRGLRLVAVSAVQFRSGLCMPLKEMSELCHRHGAELFVDAIQALGIVPLNVDELGIDYLAGGTHKWLMGVEGGGFLYVRPELAKSLCPVTAGWLSHEEPEGFLRLGSGHLRYDRPLKATAQVFECSSLNLLGFAAVDASLQLIQSLGVSTIYDHVQRYHDALEPLLQAKGFRSLRAADPDRRSGSLSFEAPEGVDVVQVQAALSGRGVSCSMPDGALRFSPHWPNSLDEVPRIGDVLNELEGL